MKLTVTQKAYLIIAVVLVLTVVGVMVFKSSNDTSYEPTLPDISEIPESSEPVFEYGSLPADIKWITNNTDPEFADSNAKRGGTFKLFELSFPMTLRTVGPDSNGTFRHFLLDDNLTSNLLKMHPETDNPIPSLATHWYHAPDHKTMYFKLNPKATWSDGEPIKASDYAYTFEFMRSKWIYAPWYNDYYTNILSKLIIIDDYTIAVVGKEAKSDFENVYTLNMSPTPRHYYQPILDKDWIKKYNWEQPPTTGAYVVDRIRKGKSITFKRIKKWWADDEKYYQNTNNFDRVQVDVIRDNNMAFDYFLKGNIDFFSVTQPIFWDKAVGNDFDNGYINKIWFYNKMPRPSFGFWLNTIKYPFDNLDVRVAFAYALNYDNVIKNVLKNEPIRLNRYHQGTGKYDNEKVISRPYDIAKVDEHMTKAGWKKNPENGLWQDDKGNDISIELIYGDDIVTPQLTVLREDAYKAGFNINLRLMDSATSFKTALEKQFQVTFFGLGTVLPLPSYWQAWHSDNAKPQTNNFTMIKDSDLDEWIDQFQKEFDDNKKYELSKKVQQRIHDLAIFIPATINPFFRGAYHPWVKLPHKIPKATYRIDELYPLAWFDADQKEAVTKAKKENVKYQEPVSTTDTTYKELGN